MHTVVFSNADSGKPRNIRVVCDGDSIEFIMKLYGGYFAGDRYTVTVDGRNVNMDINGEYAGSGGW